MSFNAKEWIKIDHNEVRYNKTVADFIFGLHGVLKVPRCIVNPWQLIFPSSFALGNISALG